jgi:SAM-dependent methyltransferase
MTSAQVTVEQNRKAWNEVASRHAAQNFTHTGTNLRTKPGFYIDPVFRDCLMALPLKGSTLAQFNCNNGRELISAIQLGAQAGIGFDFSSAFVEQARTLAEAAGVAARFVETDIYEMPAAYHAAADILFLTAGALCWMPNLRRYFETAHRVLRSAGTLILYETHPFLEMFKPDRDRFEGEPLSLHYPYFMDVPVAWGSGLDYYGQKKYGEEIVYWYHHSLSAIMQSILDAGFAIRQFAEFDHDNSIGYREVEAFAIRPPMSFVLRADRV